MTDEPTVCPKCGGQIVMGGNGVYACINIGSRGCDYVWKPPERARPDQIRDKASYKIEYDGLTHTLSVSRLDQNPEVAVVNLDVVKNEIPKVRKALAIIRELGAKLEEVLP